MFVYILKRIALFLPTLLAITLISFGISRLAPGDPAALKAGSASEGGQSQKSQISAKTVELIRKQWNLDKPIWQQYLIWTGSIITFDFGTSFVDNRSVGEKILERIPITIGMSVLSILIAYAIAIPLGIFSATHSGSATDRVLSFITFGLYSLPTFWVGTIAITFLCNPEYINIFPFNHLRSSYIPTSWGFWQRFVDVAWHIMLPMIIYTYGSFAFISRQIRSAMLETVRQDYIRTARAKGVPERSVIYKHALRNSLIPLITLLAGILPSLVGGSVIIENMFSIPGMGKLSYDAIIARDYPVIMAVFTMSAVLTLLGILIADILYSVVDPRIAFGKKS